MSIPAKGNPLPVRLDKATSDVVAKLKTRTGMNTSEVLRRAVRYAAPLFLSGQVSIADVGGDDAIKRSKNKTVSTA